jgi:hypothetical protein
LRLSATAEVPGYLPEREIMHCGTDGSQTRRWREVDSNFWFRVRGKSGLGMPSSNTTLLSSPMAAGGVDPARNCRFRDDPPALDRRKRIVLADDSIAIADQERQQRNTWARRLIAAPAWVLAVFEPQANRVAMLRCRYDELFGSNLMHSLTSVLHAAGQVDFVVELTILRF